MNKTLGQNRKTKESLIIHLSRPLRAFIKRFSLVLLFLLGMIIIGIYQSNHPTASSIRTALNETLAPVFSVLYMPIQVIASTGEVTTNWVATYHINARLKEENVILSKRVIDLETKAQENTRLKSLLNTVDKQGHHVVTARVIGSTTDHLHQYAFINAGSIHGIAKGQAVINEESLVGRISEVDEHTARIRLLSDINSRIPIRTQESNERAIIMGQNSTSLELLYLPPEHKVQPGELILTSGDGGVFPADIPIGVVTNDIAKAVYVKPFTGFNRLNYVSILLPNNTNPKE